MKSPRPLSNNPATVERRERKLYAALKLEEREWYKEIAALMLTGMTFDDAFVAAGGTIVPDITEPS